MVCLAGSNIFASEGAGFGVGAFPLSLTVVSMWLLRTDAARKPLPVLLVYFTGARNWHKRSWESKFEGNTKQEGRATYRLVSSDVTLEIAISDDKTKVWVQNREFRLDTNNLFVVKSADEGATKEKVEALGHLSLPFSDKEPLAVLVLREHPDLSAKIE
jgi:hypothetical protein